MADIIELGRRIKAKFPGVYQDLGDEELGARIRAKFAQYQDFTDPLPPGAEKTGLPGIAPPKVEMQEAGVLDKAGAIAQPVVNATDSFLRSGNRAVSQSIQGVGGATEALGGYLEQTAKEQGKEGLIGGPVKQLGQEIRKFGEGMGRGGEVRDDMRGVAGQNFLENPEVAKSPEYWADLAGQISGSMLSMMAPTGATLGYADKAMQLLKIKQKYLPLVRTTIGVGTSSMVETLFDAGNSYQEALDMGASEETARAVVAETFKRELPPTLAFNAFGIFNDMMKGGLKKFALSSLSEGAQEAAQGIAQRQSLGLVKPQSDKDVYGPALFEAIVGAAGGAFGEAVMNRAEAAAKGPEAETSLTPTETNPASQETIKPLVEPKSGNDDTDGPGGGTPAGLSAAEAELVGRMERLSQQVGKPFDELDMATQDRIYELAVRGEEEWKPESAAMTSADATAADAGNVAERGYTEEQYAQGVATLAGSAERVSLTGLRKTLGVRNGTAKAMLSRMEEEGWVKQEGAEGSKFWKIVKRPEVQVEQAESQSDFAQTKETPLSPETQGADTALDPLRPNVYRGESQNLEYLADQAKLDASKTTVDQTVEPERPLESQPASGKETARPERDPLPDSTAEGKDSTDDAKPLYEMNEGELGALEKRLANQDRQGMVGLFGRDGAAKYAQLERKADSSNASPQEKEAARAELAQMERATGKTRVELDRVIYGIGETGPGLEEVREYRKAVASITAENATELGEALAGAIVAVGEKSDPAKMNAGEKRAYAQIRQGLRLAHERGWSTAEVSTAAVRKAAQQYGDAADVELMLGRYLGQGGNQSARPAPEQVQGTASSKKRETVEQQMSGTGALSLVRPEEVRINYAKGKPTAAEIETGARVKYFAPKGDRPAVVTLNDQAMQVVGRILGTGNASGLAVPKRDSRFLRLEVGKKIARAKGEHKAALQKLGEALRQAADNNADENLVLVNGERGINRKELMTTLREELTHYEQFRLSESAALQVDQNAVTNLPQWERIDAYLEKVGYGHISEDRRVMEAGAQIAAGRWKNMGLTLEEAMDWFGQYVKAVNAWHGQSSARMTRWATGEVRQAYEKWQETYQRDANTAGTGGEARTRGVRREAESGGSGSASARDVSADSARSTGLSVSDGQAGVRASEQRTAREEAGRLAGARGDTARSAERDRLRTVRGDGESGGAQGRGRTEKATDRSSRGAGEGIRYNVEDESPYRRRLAAKALKNSQRLFYGLPEQTEGDLDYRYYPRKDRPGILYVNFAGRSLIGHGTGRSRATWNGATFPKAIAELLGENISRWGSENGLPGAEALGQTIKTIAANDAGMIVALAEERTRAAVRETARHEAFHWAQMRLGNGVADLGIGWRLERDSEVARKVISRVKENDAYADHNADEAITEATATIAGGQLEKLGIDIETASDLMAQYLDEVEAAYGKPAVDILGKNMNPQIREKALAKQKHNQQDNSSAKQQTQRDDREPFAESGPNKESQPIEDSRTDSGIPVRVRRETAEVTDKKVNDGDTTVPGDGRLDAGEATARGSEFDPNRRSLRGGRKAGDQGITPEDTRRGAGVRYDAEEQPKRRSVAEYLASKRGESVSTHPETDARAKVPTTKGGGGRIGDTSSPKTSTPSPDPGRSKKPPEVAPKSPASPEREIPVSPSYDQTRDNLIDRVGLDEATAEIVREQMDNWERQNPERRVVSFEDVIEEARERDPRLVLELDRKRAQDAVILDPALRQASKNAMNAISREIRTLNESLRGQTMTSGERERAQRKLETLERDFQRLSDVLIPTRSQIGRMLAYENLMAQQGFDVTYWLDRAKRAAKLPDGMKLPDQDIEKIREIAVKGQDAEDAAVEKASQKRRRKEAEQKAKDELAAEGRTEPGKNDLTREQVVAKARQALLDRLDRAMSDLETVTVEAVTPAERELWEQDPEVIERRAKLAKLRQEMKARRDGPISREKEVERKRLEFIARLQARAKGKELSVDPVKPEERALWENDPKVLELRAEIARKFPPPPPPGLEARKAHYRKLLLEKIDRLMREEKPERKVSKWELTAEERREVERDPEVRAAAREMARAMAEQRKDGWLDYFSALRAAGLLTALKTHARNIVGNVNFQLFHEVSRPAGMVAEFALRHFSRKALPTRTVGGISLADMKAASRAGATRGVAEAIEILKTGEVRNGQTDLFDFTRELNARHLFEGRAGLRHLAWTNDAINMVFRTLKAEDRLFKLYAYERSLREQMKLAETDMATEEMMIQAWADADFMTFNNENQFVQNWINGPLARAEKSGLPGKMAAFVVKLFLPFRNTPANIWARVVEGSGGGLISGPLKVMRQQGMLTQAQQRAIAMEMGRGATGLGLVMLGFYGGLGGWIRGLLFGDERDKGYLERAAGMAEGAIKIGKHWISIQGLSPVANLVLVGATMARRYSDPSAFVSNVDLAFAALLSTIKEQPMLRGLNDLLEAWQANDDKAAALVSNMAGSWVPSIVSSLAESTDTKRRDARGGNIIERAGKGVMARTPGLRQMLPERLDVLGRPVEQERLGTFFGFPTTRETDNAALKEMVRVGVSMGEGKRRENEKKSDYELRIAEARKAGREKPERLAKESDEEFAARQAAIGDSVLKRVERLMNSSKYQAMDTIEQQHAIEHEITSARQRAAAAVKQRAYADVPIEGKRAWLRERIGR